MQPASTSRKIACRKASSPHYVVHDITLCPVADVWRERGFYRWGHVYCDEFHKACAGTYHPDGHVVIHQNKMKGDKICSFHWVMPPRETLCKFDPPTALGIRLAESYQAKNELEGALYALKRGHRLVGGVYQAFATQAREDFGAQGLASTWHGLCKWGAERGRMMREAHQELGIEPQPANMIRYSDLPCQYVCEIEELEVKPDRYSFRVTKSPVIQALLDYDLSDLVGPFYREVYRAMAATYLPGAKVSLESDNPNEIDLTIER